MAVVRARLPYKPQPIAMAEFADELGTWVDPTGAWVQDSGVQTSLLPTARLLYPALLDLKASCTHALPLAQSLKDYMAEARSKSDSPEMTSPEFVARKSQLLSEFPDEKELLSAHLDRVLFPVHDTKAWEEIVLAAALRALVRLHDAHSEWAPADEDTDATGQRLFRSGPAPLWEEIAQGALGVTVVKTARAELAPGDEIVWVQTTRKPRLYLVGLSPEQCEQVALTASDEGAEVESSNAGTVTLRVRRAASSHYETLQLHDDAFDTTKPRLQTAHVQSSAGLIPMLRIEEMYDELSDDMHTWLRATPDAREAPLAILDLRGNGGGAVEPTLEVLGLWLGNRPALAWTASTKGSDVEVEGAPSADERWDIPVIALVDAQTASAAEMLAGALQAYGYARVVGERSFGKGCMQEAVEMPSGTPGTLSLTTALYALPNGHGVQRAGIAPDALYTFLPTTPRALREEQRPHVAPRWSTRDARPSGYARAWAPRTPIHSIMGCADEALCAALRLALKLPSTTPPKTKTPR